VSASGTTRHDAVARRYVYQLARRRTAFAKAYVWWVKDPLDLTAMGEAAHAFVGMRDFRRLAEHEARDRSDPGAARSTTVLVERLEIVEDGDLVLVGIEGSHFLWKMVRRLTGVLVAVPPADFVLHNSLFLVAHLRETPVACGALKLHADAPAELKRMWVAPSARGLGVGARLLRELEQQARSAGVRVLRLETNRALKEAIALYRTSGYREVAPFNAEPYAHHWFEKRLRKGS